MSVIVWDGKTLAADRQVTYGQVKLEGSKIKRLADGTLLGWTGDEDTGMAMVIWYEKGADVEKLPPSQTKEDWSRLIVIYPNGRAFQYQQWGIATEIVSRPFAFGAGQDFALGALAMGADARKAVEIANQYSIGCGFGVEAYDLEAK